MLRAVLTTLVVVSFLFSAAQDENAPLFPSFPAIQPTNISIVRDQWGVPHIFAPTDAEVAYGLAWANAEDDFHTMQELLFSVQGLAGREMGKEGAKRDFYVHALGIREAVEKYHTQFSTEYLRYVDGYCQGINAYAAAHRDEVRVKGSFPVEPRDVLASFVFAMSALTKGPGALSGVVDGSFDNESPTYGSNAFAFNSAKTDDGGTMLTINPHQPVEGPFSWYEAHLISEEGLNIHGAMFPGGTSIFLGNNEDLGWAHTFNHLDLVDVFRLEMHPSKKHTYRFNDEWLTLEKRKVKLKVKLKPWLPAIGVRKTTWWSKAGATVESENGQFYAIKMPATERIGAGEQWYRMNKATNFTEFYDAISMGQTTMFNIVYADRYDTIMYINNAVMPKRNPHVNYRNAVDLASDSVLWDDFHATEDLVQYINPKCGYVFNTNNLPTCATCAEEQRQITEWPDYFGFDKDLGNNNRALRFMQLMEQPGKVSFDRMKEMKFDTQIKACTDMYESIEHLLHLDLSDRPDLHELLQSMLFWDGCAEPSSVGAGVYLLTFQFLFKAIKLNDTAFKRAIKVEEADFVGALEATRRHLNAHFGGRLVPLGELQRHVRASVDLPLSGFPDALAANYNTPIENGRFKPMVGDSYTHFVKWIPGEELPYMETLHPFGSSSREGSPHYTDQMGPYSRQETKVMTLDLERVRANAVRSYAPLP